jgi:hypothetical protein
VVSAVSAMKGLVGSQNVCEPPLTPFSHAAASSPSLFGQLTILPLRTRTPRSTAVVKKRPRDKAWGLKSSQSGKRCRVRSLSSMGERDKKAKPAEYLLYLKLRRQDGHCLHTPLLVTGRPGRQFSAWYRAGWCTCASRSTLWPGCRPRVVVIWPVMR